MNFKTFIISILIIALSSCQKDIQIEVPDSRETPLIIEGILYAGQTPKIYISHSQPFFSPEVTPQDVFARNLDVSISEGSSEYPLQPDSIFNKFRCRWELYYTGAFVPEQGKSYTLELSYNGKLITASTTINQRKAEVLSVEYTPEFYDVYGGHDGVIINVEDHPEKGDYYRFQMDRWIDKSVLHAHVLDEYVNTCAEEGELFPVTDIGRVIFSDENIESAIIEMMIEVTFEYSEGDSGYIYIQTLDEQSAEFYTNLDEQLQSILNPFVEPVFVETRIEGAMGIFGSAVISDSIQFTYPQDHP
jgi:hypothetical protein